MRAVPPPLPTHLSCVVPRSGRPRVRERQQVHRQVPRGGHGGRRHHELRQRQPVRGGLEERSHGRDGVCVCMCVCVRVYIYIYMYGYVCTKYLHTSLPLPPFLSLPSSNCLTVSLPSLYLPLPCPTLSCPVSGGDALLARGHVRGRLQARLLLRTGQVHVGGRRVLRGEGESVREREGGRERGGREGER
jgi:hypothetical protein